MMTYWRQILCLPLLSMIVILTLTKDGVIPSALTVETQLSSPVMCKATLELSDLPKGFEPAPSFLQTFILQGITAVNPQLEQEGIALAETATFVDFGRTEMASGLTAILPNQRGRNRFDRILDSPEVENIFVLGLQQTLGQVGKVKVNQVQEIKALKGIGEMARGFTIEAKFETLPLKLWTSTILFRRGNYAALVILGSFEGKLDQNLLLNLAKKVDQRLQLC